MKKEVMEKIKGGKLVRVRADFDKKINKVQIVGDFFAHPEECITEIEKNLSKLNVDFDEKKQTEKLKEFVKKNNIQLIGINEESIIRLLKKVVQK